MISLVRYQMLNAQAMAKIILAANTIHHSITGKTLISVHVTRHLTFKEDCNETKLNDLRLPSCDGFACLLVFVVVVVVFLVNGTSVRVGYIVLCIAHSDVADSVVPDFQSNKEIELST